MRALASGERLATGVLTGSSGLGQTRHGVPPDGAACKGGRMGSRALATQAAPRSSRQSERLAVLPIVTHTPTPPHVAFVRAPMDDSSHQTVPPGSAPQYTTGLDIWPRPRAPVCASSPRMGSFRRLRARRATSSRSSQASRRRRMRSLHRSNHCPDRGIAGPG